MTHSLLQVRHLQVEVPTRDGLFRPAVDGLDLTVDAGEVVALVGESGCGKSLTGLALMGLLPDGTRLAPSTSIRWHDREWATASEAEWRTIRGGGMAMIFQDPVSSLNPVLRIGDQVIEAITAHGRMSEREVKEHALSLLREVGLPDAEGQFHAWPHQLSGGMRQRVMIAIALAHEPELLIADEPTTALDVTVQAQLLELLGGLAARRRMAILLITHDLAVVAEHTSRVLVMYAGRLVESAPTREFFRTAAHPYSRGLLGALPRIDVTHERLAAIPGSVPPPGQWPTGCRFNPRCPTRTDDCLSSLPALIPISPSHSVACWHPGSGGTE